MGASLGPIMGPLSIMSLVIGAFFIIRSIYRYKAWRAGEAEEQWRFIAYLSAGVGVLWFGIGTMPFYIEAMQVVGNSFFLIPAFLVLILGNVAIWITTYRYLLKWRAEK
jgi:hypothetical protein